MHLERTIWPVGHGGFYTEQLHLRNGNWFTIAYDCGARTKKIFIDSINQSSIGSTHPIDLLFISHFHKDHINGLPYLLDNNLIKHIILPQLDPSRILEAIVYNYISTDNSNESHNENDRLQEILINWVNEQKGDYTITEISDDAEVLETTPIDLERESPINLSRKLRTGTSILIANGSEPIWQYIPICYINQQQLEELKEALDDLMHKQLIKTDGTIDWDALKDFIAKKKEGGNGRTKYVHLSKIKEIYTKVFKPQNGEHPHNNYSMPVYSGPLKEVLEDDELLYHYWRHHRFNILPDLYHYHLTNILAYHSAHCLYTGDFEAKDSNKLDKIQKTLGTLWAKVGLLQIPHHVSDNNYNPGLYDHRMLCFGNVNDKKDISFSFSTLHNIIFRRHCLPIILTEKSDVLCLYYDFYA